jgi:hypothetical protein
MNNSNLNRNKNKQSKKKNNNKLVRNNTKKNTNNNVVAVKNTKNNNILNNMTNTNMTNNVANNLTNNNIANNMNNTNNTNNMNNTNVNNLNTTNSNVNNANQEDKYAIKFVKRMLESIHTIKLFHWKTKSYATHKATDNLHEKLGELVDKYVEVLIGKNNLTLLMTNYSQLQITNLDDNDSLEKFIKDLIEFLVNIHKELDTEMDTDLMNIKDEIIGELNQFIYLLRLK